MGCSSSREQEYMEYMENVRAAEAAQQQQLVNSATQRRRGNQQTKTQPQARQRVSQNPRVFFDLSQGDYPLGRIVIELFQDVVPATTENFRRFCTDEFWDARGQVQGYRGSVFHRVIPGFMCQGGDFVRGDGKGKMSIYNPHGFADENFNLTHDRPGILSMANSGPNSNGCQFFLTTVATPHLDGKHVVFGRVVKGMNIVYQIENTPRDRSDRPLTPIWIADCGQLR